MRIARRFNAGKHPAGLTSQGLLKDEVWDWTSAVPDTGLATFGVQPSVETLYLFSVAQIANLPYHRLQIGRALAVFRRPARSQSCRMASCDTADWQSALQMPPRR